METDYQNLKREKPHIAAQIKKECGIGIAHTILSALDIQEKELIKAQNALEALYLNAGSITDMVPRIGKERSDYKKFRQAMVDAGDVLHQLKPDQFKFHSDNTVISHTSRDEKI